MSCHKTSELSIGADFSIGFSVTVVLDQDIDRSIASVLFSTDASLVTQVLCSDDMNDFTWKCRDVSRAGTAASARVYPRLYSSALLNTTTRAIPSSYFTTINVEIVANYNGCSMTS